MLHIDVIAAALLWMGRESDTKKSVANHSAGGVTSICKWLTGQPPTTI